MRRMLAVPKPVAGVVVILLVALTTVLIYNKEHVGTDLRRLLTSTDTVVAEFAEQPKLREFRAGSDVKLAGVVVGTVRDISPVDHGRSRVTMQLDDGVVDKLGSAPTATVRATLLLGGRYYVDLVPGGEGRFTARTIPVARTSLPVEVSDVLGAVGTEAAQHGIRSSIRQLDASLGAGGKQALQGLVDHTPATLRPAGQVLSGLRGTRPGTDWTGVVAGLRNTASALTTQAGQVESLMAAVDDATRTLAEESKPLAAAVETMPETLSTARAGLRDLQPTLDHMTRTARDFRPSAQKLGPLTEELAPVLVQSREFLADVRPLLADAQPLLTQLAPAADRLTDVFGDLNGPVLDRVNGPLMSAVMSPYSGTGPYTGNGSSGNRLYEELGFLGVRGAQDFGWHDKVGVVARVGPTFGAGSYGALLPGTAQFLEGRP